MRLLHFTADRMALFHLFTFEDVIFIYGYLGLITHFLESGESLAVLQVALTGKDSAPKKDRGESLRLLIKEYLPKDRRLS
ncbi:hypothetical protein [Desulforhopalus sp. IMCC35007]|uniref:hypothetical protein n=1 Tax=Desulforhopalus sp. IMCC35007 TaxID=2569543 RepID=UPI0010AEAD0A|nr:hypothetical protein [Desulforhopalus sp. IMCC35007]TKB09680.1 hypothetical protein FCL48_09535 [Desulforhopalus sp. IMCC35007]